MSEIHICLDESGDLGWQFHAPYRAGGSSRYLTIASVLFDPSVTVQINRFIKKLYKKHKWPSVIEKKWSQMSAAERDSFASRACKLIQNNKDLISLYSITVYKENVQAHIRADSNKLYNYMICLSLAEDMSKYDMVRLKPDDRSVKVLNGNSLEDYLKTHLWFERGVSTELTVLNCDSSKNPIVQFSDMLAGAVQHHYEDGNSGAWRTLSRYIKGKTLFFP